jgi:uncharacterized protein (DUF1697 family)
MPIYIALLRGINVGGNKQIKMEALRALFESLGYGGAKTLLQSGNVVFASDENDVPELTQQIEAGIEDTFGFHSDIILRTAAELRSIIAHLPFAADRELDPSKLTVSFFADALDAAAVESIQELMATYKGPEELHIAERELYIYYPEGMGRSKLGEAFARKKLNRSGTVRNWNTINKLADLAGSFEDA